MEIRLLGPLEVTDGAGLPVNLAAAKLRSLVALLALKPGRLVSAERLVDALWGPEAGETARNSLQVLVSKLRRALPEDVVATRPQGYVIEVPAKSVDICRFRQLSEEGREVLAAGASDRAAMLFRQALGLWRGDALADFVFEDFAQFEIAQLTEERLAVLEDRVEADLASGRAADLVPELEAAVRASPLREQSRCQLMLALYRSGRQADALRQYQEARRALGEELGLEPGPELSALERAILAHSPSLRVPDVPPPQEAPSLETTPPAPGGAVRATSPGRVLFGRDRPLAQVRAALDRAQAGSRSVVLVSGEPGIGKTELVRLATHGQPLVAWGTCIDDAAAGGLWPWSRALEQLSRSVGIERARQLAGPDAALLATIASSFGRARSRPGTARDRFLLLDAACRWLEAVAATCPAVVVLDDLQWADGSTLSLLDLVARSPQPAALCIIGCHRSGELGEPARAQLPAMATAVEHIELGGLDRDAVADLVAAIAVVPAEGVDEIHRRAGGHPMFTRELGRVWGKGGPARIPAAVRDALELRAGHLQPSARQVLEVAALAGNEVQIALVAVVLDVPGDFVLAACREATDAGVLTGTDDDFRFAHDLYRETLAALVDPVRRPSTHLAIGTALENRRLRAVNASPADIARHFLAAVAVDGPERAARWARAAAAADRAAFAFDEAAAQLRRWREGVDGLGIDVKDELRLEMLLAEADVLARGGLPVEARRLLAAAGNLAEQTGAWSQLGEVALAVAELGAVFSARRDDVVRELDRARTAASGLDSALEARLAASLARALQHSVPADRSGARPLSERALELGREAGDAETLIACLLAKHDVLWAPGGAETRAELAQEIVDISERARKSEHRARGLLLLANARLELGSPSFMAPLEECLAQLQELGDARHLYTVATRRAAVALLRGDLDDASLQIERAAELGERIREPEAAIVHMAQRLELVRARGEPAELVAFARDDVRHWRGAPVLSNALAAGFLARAGEIGEASRHVRAVADLGTWRSEGSYAWSALVRELAVAAIALADRDLCAELLADLLPLAGTCGVNGAVVSFAGSHAHTAALLAGALGEDTRLLMAQARESYARLGAAGWLGELGPSNHQEVLE